MFHVWRLMAKAEKVETMQTKLNESRLEVLEKNQMLDRVRSDLDKMKSNYSVRFSQGESLFLGKKCTCYHKERA